VGLIPLLAVAVVRAETLKKLPAFRRRMRWYVEHRPDVIGKEHVPLVSGTWHADRKKATTSGESQPEAAGAAAGHAGSRSARGEGDILLSLVDPKQLKRVVSRMMDESQFLSAFGIRSVSKEHDGKEYSFEFNGFKAGLKYTPAESDSAMFGGNSNWRGPIWMPICYLLVEALQQYDAFYGDTMEVEVPTGSARKGSLWTAASEISQRLIGMFRVAAPGSPAAKESVHGAGYRPVFGGLGEHSKDPLLGRLVLFYEYFHGDLGAGLGASHQTGWTGLVAKLIQQQSVGSGLL